MFLYVLRVSVLCFFILKQKVIADCIFSAITKLGGTPDFVCHKMVIEP